MIFIVDTNIFSKTFKNLDMEVFDDIWNPLQKLIDLELLISVDEVFYELDAFFGTKDIEMNWLKKNRKIFQKLTNEEALIVCKIFMLNKFREGIKEKSLRNGTPEADAFLVAKAKVNNGILVTDESDEKPHSEKIPNICSHFNVPYMKKNDFYKLLKDLHKNEKDIKIKIYKSVDVELTLDLDF